MDNEKKQVTYNSSITGETQVTFDIQQYMNNRATEHDQGEVQGMAVCRAGAKTEVCGVLQRDIFSKDI